MPYPSHRLIRTPSGHVLKAKVIDPDTFGLGTQLDAFYMERKTEPSHYTPMSSDRTNRTPANRDVRRHGNRRSGGGAPALSLVS